MNKTTRNVFHEIDVALLYGLAAAGDEEGVLELGHFGDVTVKEARIRLKAARLLAKEYQKLWVTVETSDGQAIGVRVFLQESSAKEQKAAVEKETGEGSTVSIFEASL